MHTIFEVHLTNYGFTSCGILSLSIGLLRRLRDSARIVEMAHVVASDNYTDGSGKQQKAQGHSLASMKKNLKFG